MGDHFCTVSKKNSAFVTISIKYFCRQNRRAPFTVPKERKRLDNSVLTHFVVRAVTLVTMSNSMDVKRRKWLNEI